MEERGNNIKSNNDYLLIGISQLKITSVSFLSSPVCLSQCVDRSDQLIQISENKKIILLCLLKLLGFQFVNEMSSCWHQTANSVWVSARCVTHLTAAAGTNQESLGILTICEVEQVSACRFKAPHSSTVKVWIRIMICVEQINAVEHKQLICMDAQFWQTAGSMRVNYDTKSSYIIYQKQQHVRHPRMSPDPNLSPRNCMQQ